jgi:hypothetical protein
MNIDPDKLKQDESVSNPMAVGFRYADCPISRTCFHVVVGFGTQVEVCPHFKDESTAETPKAECTYEADAAALQSGG